MFIFFREASMVPAAKEKAEQRYFNFCLTRRTRGANFALDAAGRSDKRYSNIAALHGIYRTLHWL
jgi:hypothetical protein